MADVDSPRTKEAYNRYVLFKNSANDLVQERTGLRTELETIKVKHGDYIQKMEKLLEQAVEQAGKTANVENEHQVERKLKEERALYKIVLDDLNERLSVEQETHAAATASNCTLQSEIAELKASLDEAKTAEFEAIRYQEDLIKRKDLELKDIRGVLSSLQHELQNLHESRQSELDAKLSELSQEHEKVIADLRAKHEDALSSMSEERLASMVHESNATEESKRELKAFLQSEIDTLKKDKASLEDSLNQQLAEVHAAKQSLQEELKLEREARDVALQAREEDNQELVRASEETQRAAASSAEKNISLQKEIDQCKETIETLKTARAVAQDEIHRLNASDDAHVQKIEELKRQLRQKDTDSKKDGKTAEQWKQAYSIMNKEHADGLSDLQKLMESLQEAQQALREKEVNTSDLREQIAGYSGQLGLLQSQMTEKEGRIRVLGTELLSSQENLKSAKAQLDAVRLPRENREDYSRSTSPSKKQIRQLRKSRSKLLEKDLSNDSMASKNDNTESERNMSPEDKSTMTESVSSEVQKSLKSAEEKNRSLEEQLEKAQDVADAKSTKLNEIEALLKVTAAELTELKTNRIKRTAAESEARASSPKPPKTPSTPTRKVTPLRSSGWALGDRTNQNEDGGNSLQGTVSFPFSSPTWTPFR